MRKRDAGLMPDGTASHELAAPVLPASRPPRRGVVGGLQVFCSILFRIVAYIFLRWIPTKLATPILYSTGLLYVLTSWILDRRYRRWDATNLPSTSALHAVDVAKYDGALPKRCAPRRTFWQRIGDVVTLWSLGLSSPSRRLNVLSHAAHAVVFLMCMDSLWSPYLFPSQLEDSLTFARMGFVDATTAKIHLRYPNPALRAWQDSMLLQDTTFTHESQVMQDTVGNLGEEPIFEVVYRETTAAKLFNAQHDFGGASSAGRWHHGPLVALSNETDWTTTVQLTDLWPATEYEWRLKWLHNNSQVLGVPHRPIFFTTFPDPKEAVSSFDFGHVKEEVDEAIVDMSPMDDPNLFTFASSSCTKADFPYHPAQFPLWRTILRSFGIGLETGGITTRNRLPGFDLLAEKTIAHTRRPTIRFFLHLGDAIYADVPRYGGATKAAYWKLWRNLYASESFRRVYEAIPVFGCWDDHEVINNFGRTLEGGQELPAYAPGEKAYEDYLGHANPDPLAPGEHYYTFRYGDTSFFVMDTRGHRTPASAPDDENKSMLGAEQYEALMRWLSVTNTTATFKFVISSVPFNTMWGGLLDVDGQFDSWAAYTHERQQIMEVMKTVPNIIVLSGDRHEFSASGIGAEPGVFPVTEFSTSPLSMFYLPVRTYSQDNGLGEQGLETVYKYLPDGNVKWTTFTVDTRDAQNPVVHVKTLIDGEVAWQVKVVGVAVREPPAAVGGIAKSFWELMKLMPRRWF